MTRRTAGDEAEQGGRVERRKARTRAGLLAAARELFAKQGIEHTTIAQIAAHADIAIGSFYNYFRTKELLLDALLEEELTRQLTLLQGCQAQAEDPAEKISIAHRRLVRVARQDADWAWLMLRLDVSERVAWAVLGEPAADDLRAGIEIGRFEVPNEALALTASGGALLAVIHAQLLGDGGPEADSEHAEGVLRMLGIDRDEAREIARRALPEPDGGND